MMCPVMAVSKKSANFGISLSQSWQQSRPITLLIERKLAIVLELNKDLIRI
jgi:hypothetical protein